MKKEIYQGYKEAASSKISRRERFWVRLMRNFRGIKSQTMPKDKLFENLQLLSPWEHKNIDYLSVEFIVIELFYFHSKF